jgi:hypothetical protein
MRMGFLDRYEHFVIHELKHIGVEKGLEGIRLH